eukprot:3283915-Ditylum_brightwellii.AAC.1
MNSLTESASNDQCVDETLWPHMGFGSEVLRGLVGKTGINKGGQTVISFDAGLGHRGRDGNQEHDGSGITNVFWGE